MTMRLSYSVLNTGKLNRNRLYEPVPAFFLTLLCIALVIPYTFCQTPQYVNSFPIMVDSSRKPSLMNSSTPLVTDLDGNNLKEIVFFVHDFWGLVTPFGRLHAIDYHGNELPGFPRGYDEAIISMASGDVNGDGKIDLVLRFTNTIDAIDITGSHLPGFPIQYMASGYDIDNPIAIYDLNSDGRLEIIVNKENEICVFESNGIIKNGWPRKTFGYCRAGFTVGNLDNVGDAEIIAPTMKRYTSGYVDSSAIRVFRSNGENYSSNWPMYSDSNYFSWGSRVSLSLNRTHSDSSYIVIATQRRNEGAFSLNRQSKYDLNGNLLARGFSYVMNAAGSLSIGDFDRNGKVEFANGNQGHPTDLIAFNNSMLRIPGYWPQEGVGQYEAIPCIGKLTYFNRLNIIDNTWFANEGKGHIYSYESDGNELSWSPLRPVGLVQAMSLADINNDGSTEIIAVSSRTGYESFLHVWSIDGKPFSIENFPWPMTSHDRYRTNQHGFIPPDEPVGIQPISNVVPEKFELHQNFPNPFNPTTTIRFDVRTAGNVSLKVFDVLGREVAVLADEFLRAGSYERVFESADLSSGVYFYTLMAGEFEKTLRMVVLR